MRRGMSDARKLSLAYAGLLVLLALTVGSSLIDLGGLNSAINLLIAAAKAAVIAVIFMHVSSHGVLPRLVVAATGFWLVIMFGLTLIG
jgi:cytochrome c oxidase subunit 4